MSSLVLVTLMSPFLTGAVLLGANSPLDPKLATYVEARAKEFDTIPEERQKQLLKISKYVRESREAGRTPRMTFICTHNSRRSHLSQIWAKTAGAHYGIEVETFSGGTEGTAFNPRAVATLRRAGFAIPDPKEEKNPRYEVKYAESAPAMVCFSKKYDQDPNPKADFCAVLVCSDADQKCPVVSGATVRIPLPFEDPKVSDNTLKEAATYDERCQQIAREMLFVMSRVEAK
jgi:arsenate reductase (thioredoxin)